MTEDDINKLIFKTFKDDAKLENQRAAIRYIRSDISVSISKPGLFNLTKFIPVTLLDISSKGATIECNLKIAVNKAVIIYLLFTDNTNFTINATVMHLSYNANTKNKYGLKFSRMSNALGDFLLSSQSDFKFK